VRCLNDFSSIAEEKIALPLKQTEFLDISVCDLLYPRNFPLSVFALKEVIKTALCPQILVDWHLVLDPVGIGQNPGLYCK
jgi:hypothetical protein